MIGHRGAAAVAPENTLAGLRRAAAEGVRWVEVDVQLSADGVALLLHDPTLDRTTTGHGAVADWPWERLRGLDAGAWFGPLWAGEPLPTLAAALDEAAVLGLGLVLELKSPSQGGAALARTAWAVVEARHRASPFVFSSFDLETLETLAGLAGLAQGSPPCRRALLAAAEDDWSVARLVATAHRLGCDAVHLDDALAAPETLQILRRNRLEVVVWTVNDADRALALWDGGACAVISDQPAALLAVGGIGVEGPQGHPGRDPRR